WIRDLVAVQMEDWQHATVAGWVEELVAMPASGERTSFRFTVTDDAGHNQVRIIERRTVSVGERVAKFAAFVDGTGRLWRDVAGDAAGEAELLEELLHASSVLADVRVEFAVGSFKIGMRNQRRAAV